MKIFLSWSGDASLAVANIFHELLPCIHQSFQPFLSKHDIDSGARWSLRIAKELEDTDYGILFLTQTNLSSAWIQFEAGALTKHVDGRACSLLLSNLELRDVVGPLSQFQNHKFSEAAFSKLIKDMHKLSGASPHTDIQRIISKWWPDVKNAYDTVDFSKKELEIQQTRNDTEVLSEILQRVRELERSVVIQSGNAIMFGQTGPINEGSVIDAVEILAKRLPDKEFSILKQIAQLKLQNDQIGINKLLDETDASLISRLVDSRLLRRHPEKRVSINRLLGEVLRQINSSTDQGQT